MLILFPSDPFETHKPDPDYATEIEIAKEAGHEVAFVHYESLVNDKNPSEAVRRVQPRDQVTQAIYRGWMLTSEQYEELFEVLDTEKDIELVTKPQQYRNAHELPEWCMLLHDITPKSDVIYKQHVSVENVLERAGELLDQVEHGILIKDFVKSRKHEWEEACFIPNIGRAKEVITNFLERQGSDLQGGVVLREYVPLKIIGEHPQSGMPMGEEFRIFWVNGYPCAISQYWPDEFYEGATVDDGGHERKVPYVLDEIPQPSFWMPHLDKIASPMISMDIARSAEGEWFIIEIGDLQVSGFPRPRLDSELFYSRVEMLLNGPDFDDPDVPDASGDDAVTQQELDAYTCHAEGCDHKGHSGEMVLHPRCHLGAPTWAVYEGGVLNIRCVECERTVIRIAVAPGDVIRH